MNDFSKIREWIQKWLKNRSRADFFIMILAGVLLMVIVLPTGQNDKKNEELPQVQTADVPAKDTTAEAYRSRLEKQLAEFLSQMEGAGRCEVMLMLADSGQTYVDKNVNSGEDRREETTVVYDRDTGDEPWVVREEQPKIAGVVVMTEGGGNPKVVAEISRSVMSLFQLEAHKITVVKMSVQEE